MDKVAAISFPAILSYGITREDLFRWAKIGRIN
jgi:hypothetical protein